MWTHKLNSYNEAPIWMGMCSTTQFMFVLRCSLLLVWPPKLLSNVDSCIYLPVSPAFANQPFTSLIFHISSLSFTLYPSVPQKSFWTPQTSRYCLVCFHHTASASQLESDLQTSKIRAIFSICNWGSAHKVNGWKIWVDDWVNERITSVYFKFNELTQAWDGEES